jgi:hypothetical protein
MKHVNSLEELDNRAIAFVKLWRNPRTRDRAEFALKGLPKPHKAMVMRIAQRIAGGTPYPLMGIIRDLEALRKPVSQ